MDAVAQEGGSGVDLKSRPRFSLGLQVLLALVLGVAIGLFFGEGAVRFKFIGDIYVRLLQMMVLPYLILSLISGLGKLSPQQAKLMAKRALAVLLVFWVIFACVLMLLPLALPTVESASFYSSSLVETRPGIDFVDLFVPKNVFASLADNKIPAVVVFCLALGVALMVGKDKEEFFRLFDVLTDAVTRVIKFVVRLTPLGVLAMTATAAGTISFEDLGRIQGYLILYTVAAAILGFGVLPGLIAGLTPFRYGQIMRIAWSAMVLAFAADKALVALPLLIESLKRLFDEHGGSDDRPVSDAQMLVPVAYAFPGTGKLLSLLFIPFAAWFIGTPLAAADYPLLISTGVAAYFGGSASVVMPFLLDLMRLPADLFDLFIVTGVYNARLGNALRVMDLFTISVLVACAMAGMLKVRWRSLLLTLGGSAALLVLCIVGVHRYLGRVSEGAYDRDLAIASMQLMEEVVATEMVEAEPNPVPLAAGQSRLSRIRERGILRVGYHADRLPYSYINLAGKLVGLDIDLGQHLARDLGVRIEWAPFTFESLNAQLEADHFDIAMSGIYGTVERSAEIRFSEPYLIVTMGLVVPDYRDKQFSSPEKIREQGRLRVGIHRSLADKKIVNSPLRDDPNVEFVVLDSYRLFFDGEGESNKLDALYTAVESGSAWTLLYPEYQAVTTWKDAYTIPLVYPYGAGPDDEMDEFLDHWIMLKQHDGTISRAYEHWILGTGSERSSPRWSIIRDVLHWVE